MVYVFRHVSGLLFFRDKLFERFRRFAKLLDPFFDDVLLPLENHQQIDVAFAAKQLLDLAQRKFRAAAIDDDACRFDMALVVVSVSRVRIDERGNKQVFLVIEADRLHGELRELREFAS